MSTLTFFILLVVSFIGIFVSIWRIRYESVRSRKVLEGILEILTPPPEPGTVTKKSLEHYQHFFGDKK